MPAASYEIVNKLLFITGSLDRSSEAELTQALERYMGTVPADCRVVDMSNVRWLVPTGAQALISAAQDTSEKGGRLKVLASRHVMQTLNLLGAKTWLDIEPCPNPNPRPEPEASPAPVIGSVAAPAESTGAALSASTSTSGAAAVGAAPAAAPSAAGSGATHQAVRQTPAVTSLVSPGEELQRGAALLRAVLPNRRYSFHFSNGTNIMGFVRERIGGSWILVETSGTRKIVNLDLVDYCEIL